MVDVVFDKADYAFLRQKAIELGEKAVDLNRLEREFTHAQRLHQSGVVIPGTESGLEPLEAAYFL